mmetsp:Transcript_93806/g.268540  ORF Transcript_93806/g.268540 Transcript_93806/m.268540 type:complete len:328 (+) Transcript_93806:1532-2515(+)
MTSYIRAARAQLLMYTFDGDALMNPRPPVGTTWPPVAATDAPPMPPPPPQSDATDAAAAPPPPPPPPCLRDPMVIVRRALLYNDAGLDVTSDNKSVLTCAEFWVKPAASPPPSPRTPAMISDFVGGGPAEGGDVQAEEEDEEMEKQGFERVAHLIRVSLSGGEAEREGAADDVWSGPSSPVDAMQLELPVAEPKSGAKLPMSAPAGPGPDNHGQLLACASLDGLWGGVQGGTFVTSVKLSPSGAFVLLGCSRGNFEGQEQTAWQHPVAAVWRLGDMARMDTLTCAAGDEDDANVALFHPRSGSGVVYGTKQGQIACALSTVEIEAEK